MSLKVFNKDYVKQVQALAKEKYGIELSYDQVYKVIAYGSKNICHSMYLRQDVYIYRRISIFFNKRTYAKKARDRKIDSYYRQGIPKADS